MEKPTMKKIKPLSIKAIDALIAKGNLTEEEKSIVVYSIYNNKKANKIATNGAIINGNLNLAADLIMNNK